MHFDLNKNINFLNNSSIALFFIGLYLTTGHPEFFIGKQNFLSHYFLPLYSIIIFVNSILIILSKTNLKLIPNSKVLQATLLFLISSTFFSIFLTPEFTLIFFSLILFIYNLENSSYQHIQKTLFFSTIVVSFISVTQFMIQSDLNLQFLGEPIINSKAKGVSKLSSNIIRPYGLFQHPNILAGILVITSFLNPYKSDSRSTIIQNLSLLLSFSLNGYLAFSSKYIKSKTQFSLFFVIGLILFILIKSPDFIIERLSQIIELIYNPYQSKPWEIQPIHNTFILSLIKYGPVHLLSLLYLIFNIYQEHKPFSVALIILLSFDHYFLTSYQAIPILITTIYLLDKSKIDLEKQPKTLES